MTDGAGSTNGRAGELVGGRYRVGAVLGSGATAEVHRAVDTRLGRAVAVKLFRAGTDVPGARRLAEEARLLASLRHPALVGVYDAGSEDGQPYLVMTLVEGETLRQRLARGPLGVDRCVALGTVLADVLAHVHVNGIVHRDVKPSNVLLDGAGSPLLTDFGISRLLHSTRLTTTGLAVGTVAYMAPEQVRGGTVGPPADVYALGLVLLQCLTGRVEYPGTLIEAAVARLARPPRVPPELPAPVRAVLAAMTADEPGRRPSAQRCRELLSAALREEDPTVRLVSGRGASGVSTPLRRGLVAGVGAAALAAVVGAGLAWGDGAAPATPRSAGTGAIATTTPAPVTVPTPPPGTSPAAGTASPAGDDPTGGRITAPPAADLRGELVPGIVPGPTGAGQPTTVPRTEPTDATLSRLGEPATSVASKRLQRHQKRGPRSGATPGPASGAPVVPGVSASPSPTGSGGGDDGGRDHDGGGDATRTGWRVSVPAEGSRRSPRSSG